MLPTMHAGLPAERGYFRSTTLLFLALTLTNFSSSISFTYPSHYCHPSNLTPRSVPVQYGASQGASSSYSLKKIELLDRNHQRYANTLTSRSRTAIVVTTTIDDYDGESVSFITLK